MLQTAGGRHRRSRITSSVDFETEGRQNGFLSVPYSQHDSAYGRIQIPVTCIRNGQGPTVLLIAGVHGDEYEGQIALGRLARDLAPEALCGRLIVLPALNLPAVAAARRVSPLDGGNLNRLFPGDPDGSPTEMIAHYVEQVLLPMADLAIDLHSGGSSLSYAPCAIIRDDGPDDFVARQFAALRAFGGRHAYVTDGRNQGAERTFAAAAARSGVVAVTTELGGAAYAGAAGIGLAEDGIRRVLHHLGMTEEGPASDEQPLRLMQVEGPSSYSLAPEDGIFECLVDLESEVVAGMLAGYVHCPDTPWRPPVPIHVETSGFVICKRAVAWTRRGDCLLQILAPYAGKGLRI